MLNSYFGAIAAGAHVFQTGGDHPPGRGEAKNYQPTLFLRWGFEFVLNYFSFLVKINVCTTGMKINERRMEANIAMKRKQI